MDSEHEETSRPAPQNSPDQGSSDFWEELVKFVLLAVVIVVPFRLYVAQPFIVDGLSMYPTFDNGDYLIIDELTYHFEEPLRGSVLVFKYPKNPKKYFIKRVIGLPGETVVISGGKVTVKSDENPDGLILDEPYVRLPKDDTLAYTLAADEYFVMGDNRAASADSRIWGPVPKANIVGRPFVRFVPPGLFPGQATYPAQESNNNP